MSIIAPAFIKAKKAFLPALKDKTNPAYKTKYADLRACLEAVDDALLNNNIAMYQETFEDLTGVSVETVFLHESGEIIRCGRLHVPASKQDPQGYGSALSYARRYSLMTACGIAAEDDDGQAATSQKAVPKPAAQVAKPAVGLSDDDMDILPTAMQECEDFDALKVMFSSAYKKGNDAQKSALKAVYDAIKIQRKWK